MRREDYDAWKKMPLTREVFELIKLRQKEQNEDFLLGRLRTSDNNESLQFYDKIVAYNKAIDDLMNLEYEQLVELPTKKENEEKDGSSENSTRN